MPSATSDQSPVTGLAVREILTLACEATRMQNAWRARLRQTFPEGSPVRFGLKTDGVISYHDGTASKHQAGEACDDLIVNVDPTEIPDSWKWKLSNGPCSCCNKFYFIVSLRNVLFCLK